MAEGASARTGRPCKNELKLCCGSKRWNAGATACHLFADEKAHRYKDRGVEFFPTRCLRVLSTRDAQLQQVLARQGHPHKGFGCHAPYLFAKREPTLPRDIGSNAPTLALVRRCVGAA